METPGDFTPDELDQIFAELRDLEDMKRRFRTTATPQLAQSVSRIANVAPQLPLGVVMPLANTAADYEVSGGTRGMPIEQAEEAALDINKMVLTDPKTYEQEPKQQGGWLSGIRDGVMDKVKEGSRWTFAALNFPLDVVQSAGARLYSGLGGPNRSTERAKYYSDPKTGVLDGWFASTDLGAMFSGRDPGEGFFIGEDAKQYQVQKAKDYRGTVGEGGWTFGRGLALIGTQPGTREFNILSGLVDAATAISVPAIPGQRFLRRGVGNVASEVVGGRRSVTGLTNFESPQIIRSRASSWLQSNDGKKVVDFLTTQINTPAQAVRRFKNMPVSFLKKVAETTNHDDMAKLLDDVLGKGLYSTDQINLSRRADLADKMMTTGFKPVRRTAQEVSRLRGKMPMRREVSLNLDDEMERTRSLYDLDAYMKLLRVDQNEADELINRLADVVSLDDVGDFRQTMGAIDKVIARQVAQGAGIGKVGRGRRINEDAVFTMMKKYRETTESHLYAVQGPGGKSDILGMKLPGMELEAFTKEGDRILVAMPDQTAGLNPEMRRYAAVLPDPRALRRTTSTISWAFEADSVIARNPQKFGDPRGFTVFFDWAQNRVWRTGTLMTGGYAVRNISESMVRSALAPGIDLGPRNPIDWILAMTNRRYAGSILGFKWTDEALTAEARKTLRTFRKATQGDMREMTDAAYLQRRAYETGAWAFTTSAADKSLYVQGLADQIQLASEDDLVRLIANGANNADVLNWLRTTDEGRNYAKVHQAKWRNSRPTGADETVRVTYDFVDDAGNINVANWEKTIDGYFRPLLDYYTGKDDVLKSIIATGDQFGIGEVLRNGQIEVPVTRAFNYVERIPGVEYELSGYSDEFMEYLSRAVDDDVARAAVGEARMLPENVKYRVQSKHKLGTIGYEELAGQPFQRVDALVTHFFSGVFSKKEAYLNRSPAFRKFYVQQLRNLIDEVDQENAFDIVQRIRYAYSKDVVDQVKALEDAVIRYADSSGVIKYSVGSEILDEAAYNARLAEARALAKKKGEGFTDAWAEKYLGDKELWRKIKAYSEGKGVRKKGGEGITSEELNTYAMAYAAEETKKLFYNATERSNLADIMRIISPFGQAWAEVMKAWYRLVITDPNKLKNMSVTFKGIRDMDPDADGKGFIYKDPVTNEMMFNYPFVPAMAPIVFGAAGALGAQTVLGRTALGMRGAGLVGLAGGAGAGALFGQRATTGGLDPTLAAPVKSANMALNVLPSVGPVVQIAANQILGDRPQYDDLRAILLPYGSYEPTPTGIAEQVTPSWARKLIQAIRANPDTDRMYADMYMDSYRALFATGNYDNNSTEDMGRLDRDAKRSARYLLGIRAIGQFVGPARPDVTLNVPTSYEGEITIDDVTYLVNEGNIPNNVLSKAFRYFQEEDFDNAVMKFLNTFGDDTFLYVKGTTTAISKGIDASEEFGDWERTNKEFRDQHRDVYGYFSDVGSQFDLETYLRQIKSGDRRRVTNSKELRQESEAVVGKAMYRNAVRSFGPNPTEPQQNMLRAFRLYLNKALPGYSTAPLDINELADTIRKLEVAARDTLVDGNEIAVAARLYFDKRNDMIGVAQARRQQAGGMPAVANELSGKANADLRAYLRHTGEILVKRYPEFERMFSRELYDEIDIDF